MPQSKLKSVFCSLALLLLLAGCSDPAKKLDIKPKGARLTPREVLHIAHIAAEREGINPRHFKGPDINYETVRARTWQVFYETQDLKKWKPFSIFVEDETEDTRFIQGP